MFKGLIGALRVDLGMNSAQFQKGADQAVSTVQRVQNRMNAIGTSMRGIGTKLSVGATLPLVTMAKKSMDAAAVQEKAVAAVEAGLASMGDVAGYTSQQLQDMASELQNKSLYGDEEILQKVTANLLTFGNVSDDVFARAQQASLDLSARLGQDLQSSTVMLGKALNDPVKGITALTRVGVAFTEQQKDQIKAMAEAGDVAGAQGLILDELNKQYAGQAEALRNLPAGQIQAASMAIGDAMEKVGSIILPIVADVAAHIEDLAVKFQNLSPETQKAAVLGSALAAAMGPVALTVGAVVTGIGALISPIGLAVAGIGALVGAGAYLVTHWGELSERFPVLQQVADAARAAFEAFTPVIDFFREQFSLAVETVSALISGDWAAAWEAGGTFLNNAVDGYVAVLSGLGEKVLEILANLGEMIGDKMSELGDKMRGWAGNVVEGFVQGFKDKVAAAKASVTEFGDNVAGWFKDKLGIHSPSKVFEGFGVNLVEGLVVGVQDAAPLAQKAVSSLGESLTQIASSTGQSISQGFASSLAQGDLVGGVKGVFSNYMSGATQSFTSVLSDAFTGGGFASIGTSLSTAWSGVTSAVSGISWGSASSIFSGIGAAASAALPIIGAVGAVFGLIKGFSSKKLIGTGFDFSFKDGELLGGTYETWKKKSWWGLKTSTKTKLKAFDDETSAALMEQIEAVQKVVSETYKAAGEAVEEGFVEGFDYDFGKISTKGLSEDEIAEKISEAFSDYGDAISEAIGGVSLELASTFAQVKNILEPIGQAFLGTFAEMAEAASKVADLVGGTSALSSGVSSFVATYFSEAERFQMVSDQVAAVFDDLSMAIPDTLKGFRELILSQDLMTESGRETYAALLGVADAFAAVNSGLDESFDASGGWYANEYEARLAQVAAARGYSTVTEIAQSSGTTQYGRTSLGGDEGAAVQLLQTMVGIFKTWDEEGYPQERSF
ncbi:phage tail length tape measure family protein [Celeribacter halophilus]|uniref:phage tail length tape measure family protein n=1 Tax=Celeribacter halophilus TaxID=576117 RepID=UPI0026E157BB|nr:phage tail length tape measure family protein [Celeribacter halophilus]MDO6722644.1 phage tail length tape measure family protein [Celeribacter halophilus]